MSKIVLISCVSKKLGHSAKARDLYISSLFKYNLRYAESLSPDKIFILSAKYGLVGLNEEIEPYNKTLNKMSSRDVREWSNSVLSQLKKMSDVKKDEFIFLAGNKYREYLVPNLVNHKVPMKGLSIGKQLKYLKQKLGVNKRCEALHQWFNGLPRHKFPFDEKEIPLNGIYVLFEKGEFAHEGDRIVRIGTHTGNNNLRLRLKEHFINEVKDRSIFRKNIGRCLLKGDPFLKDWDLTPLIRDVREKNPNIDFERQKETEKQVSKVIREKFTFSVIPFENKEKRLEFESKIISTISLCGECKPSGSWFGLLSPKEKIRRSGLWLVNELWKVPLFDRDMDELRGILKVK